MQKIVRDGSLRHLAARTLHGAIVSGDLEPGEVYSAQSLAEKLGVSATPVREAMLELANRGLVEPVRNRGFRILTVSDQDLDEISEVRLMLEPPAMRRVVALAADYELNALDSMVARIQDCAAREDVPAFLAADHEIHIRLLELTGNKRLVTLVAQLRDQTRLTGLTTLAESGQLEDAAAEHTRLLEALRRRAPDDAENIMRVHVRHTRGVWAGQPNHGDGYE